RISSLRTQLGQQQDDMNSKINLLWKTISEKLDDAPIRNTTGSLTAQMNFTSTNFHTEEELQGKGIKSSSKLLSLKYLSQSSLAELIEDEEEVKSKEKVEEETKEETKEETEEEEEGNPEHFDTFPTMNELRYHEWLLKNPRPHG
ncbi:hypothetical protein Tco_1115941, partial [Tanacetum coccineum]